MMGGGFILSHVRCNRGSLHRPIGLCYPPLVSPPLSPWPALIATARGALWRAGDGTIERLSASDAALRAAGSVSLVCHAPAVAARLGLDDLVARDLLELFAFVRPARFCLPTPRGLCEALDLGVPATPEEEALVARDGVALLCPMTSMICLGAANARAAAVSGAKRKEVEARRSYLGSEGRSERYVVFAIPPVPVPARQ